MAVSNSGMTLFTHNDSDVGWAGEDGTSTEVFWQGSGSQQWIVAKNGNETATHTLSDNFGSSKYFTFGMLSTIAPFYTSINLELQSTASNFEAFVLSNQTAGVTFRAIDGTFKFSAVVCQFGQGTSTGTYARGSHTVLRVNVDNSSSGNIRSVLNHYIDAMYHGNGRIIGGTTTGDQLFKESNDLDISGDTFDCCTLEFGGEIFSQTDIELTATAGNSYGETLVFRNNANTDNAHTLLVSGTIDFINTIIKAETGATIAIDATAATSFDMTGGSVVNGGNIGLKTGQTIQGVVFTSCAEIDTNGATLSNCVINSTTEATTGSLLVNTEAEGELCSDIKFNTFGTNYAVYVAAGVTTFDMDNWIFDDPNNTSNVAVHWLGTSGTLTINALNGTNLVTAGCTAETGGTVEVVANPVTTEITVKDINTGSPIENARVLVTVADGINFPYQITVTGTSSGTTATITHTAHGLATNDNIYIFGANEEEYNGAFQITVTGANTYTYVMNAASTTPATGTLKATLALINGLSNASGIISDTRSMGSDQLITGRVRMSSGTPFYKTSPITGTVDSTTGVKITQQLIRDD